MLINMRYTPSSICFLLFWSFLSDRNWPFSPDSEWPFLSDANNVWAVVLDLSKYFDTLNHDRLIRELRKTIKDEKVMIAIKKFLKAGVMENGVVIKTKEGSPQGSLCGVLHYAKLTGLYPCYLPPLILIIST